MSFARQILLRMFGRPRGPLGRLGGIIMARLNETCSAWVIDLLEVRSTDRVLEIGFGPGVAIKRCAALAARVEGVDVSAVMLAQAKARNAREIAGGQVRLHLAGADSLPFEDETFDKAIAVNSLQVWPEPLAGLREIHRVLRTGGLIALAFTPYSGQTPDGVPEQLTAAGFEEPRVVESNGNFCVLARKA